MKRIAQAPSNGWLTSLGKAQSKLKNNPLLLYKLLSAVLFVIVASRYIQKAFNSLANLSIGLEFTSKELLLVLCCLTFLILVISLFSFTYLHMKMNGLTRERTTEKQEKYQEYFAGVVSSNHEETIIQDKKQHNHTYLSKEDLLDTENRTVLLKELKNIHSFIKGAERARLKELYLAFGFVDELKAKLESSQWVVRVEAINEVKQFALSDFYHLVEEKLKDVNPSVRKAALSVCMETTQNPIEVLGKLEEPMSRWEEHVLIESLDRLPNHRLPYFAELVGKYPTHSEFLLGMTERFNQYLIEKIPKKMHAVA